MISLYYIIFKDIEEYGINFNLVGSYLNYKIKFTEDRMGVSAIKFK